MPEECTLCTKPAPAEVFHPPCDSCLITQFFFFFPFHSSFLMGDLCSLGKDAVVIGSGPAGILSAIEFALLGAEKVSGVSFLLRNSFTQ